MKNLSFIILLSSLFLFSCEKNPAEPSESKVTIETNSQEYYIPDGDSLQMVISGIVVNTSDRLIQVIPHVKFFLNYYQAGSQPILDTTGAVGFLVDHFSPPTGIDTIDMLQSNTQYYHYTRGVKFHQNYKGHIDYLITFKTSSY